MKLVDPLPARNSPEFALVDEPFDQGRSASRMFFDFGIMLSCFRPTPASNNSRVLDFAAGTGWLSEWLNRIGYDTHSLDIDVGSQIALQLRARCDGRIDGSRIHSHAGDAHHLPFEDGLFSHVCCFDSLHHMHDYPRVFTEIFRVLDANGRAIFVEPGAKHSKSKETIEFIEKHKKHDPTWIERDVVLDEINVIATRAGFKRFVIRPSLWPQLREYDLSSWKRLRQGDQALGKDYLELLTDFNFNSRIAFYIDK